MVINKVKLEGIIKMDLGGKLEANILKPILDNLGFIVTLPCIHLNFKSNFQIFVRGFAQLEVVQEGQKIIKIHE